MPWYVCEGALVLRFFGLLMFLYACVHTYVVHNVIERRMNEMKMEERQKTNYERDGVRASNKHLKCAKSHIYIMF